MTKQLATFLFALASIAPAAGAADFDAVSTNSREQLQKALVELAEVQKQIGAEKIPLSKKISQTEQALQAKRKEYESAVRARDNRLVDLNALKTEVNARREELKFLDGLLNEYAQLFETRIHIAEVARYDPLIGDAKAASAQTDLEPVQRLEQQLAVVEAALERTGNLIGGTTFAGRALSAQGILEQGRFSLLGPLALFASEESSASGLAELKLGSPEPTIISIEEQFLPGIRALVSSGSGEVALDVTQGNARKIAATRTGVIGHIRKGGPVMVPILGIGFAALIICLIKWFQISRVGVAGPRDLQVLLGHLLKDEPEKATARARSIKGPVGEMLVTAIHHVGEPKEFIEEVMYEKMLSTKPRLERLLPFIALTAATAPLLGLLGTVTGMINTFNMITVFGTGDPKTLAGGISEALITTEFGLIVAVPALLMHAFVNRKVKGVMGSMEQTAVGFINGIPIPQEERLQHV